MRRGGPLERARSALGLAPQTAAQEQADLEVALFESRRTAALEGVPVAVDGGWELVGEPEAEAAPEEAADERFIETRGAEAATALEAFAVAYSGDPEPLRLYVLFAVGEDQRYAGIHVGLGTRAYDELTAFAAGRRLRWRRVRSMRAALALWQTERRMHQLPTQAALYQWR